MKDEMDGKYNKIIDNHKRGNDFKATIIQKIMVEVTKRFKGNEVRFLSRK
jgi:hypothetical protein